MRISQLIHKLSMVQDEHGNVEVTGPLLALKTDAVVWDGDTSTAFILFDLEEPDD